MQRKMFQHCIMVHLSRENKQEAIQTFNQVWNKINPDYPADIIRMLNNRFALWIGIAFVIAIPASYYVMNRWLQNFAHKTSLDWWVFALSGLLVLLLSAISISWQSWQAANLNPVKSLKSE